jgi:hypothetical protein
MDKIVVLSSLSIVPEPAAWEGEEGSRSLRLWSESVDVGDEEERVE